MSTNVSEVQETILKAVDVIINQRNNELKLDKTITGIVKKNLGIRNGKPLYQIEYNGGYIDAIAQNTTDSYTPHTAVYVMIPQSDFSKEKIIIGRASTISTDRSSSIVAAAINQYSITGANLISSMNDDNINNITYGLRSYHSIDEELTNPNSINHRAQLLYGGDSDLISFNNKNFNIYKEESTAIMIKADFMTNLSSQQKQQTNARYGLIFNFSVNNLNKGYGETQGEILENIGNIIKGTVVDEDGNLITTTFNEYVDNYIFKNYWEVNNWNTWVNSDIGLLDIAIERTKAIYEAFQIDHADENTDIVINTVKAYLALLNELQGLNSAINIKDRYSEWKATEIGDSKEKIEQFVLTSDDMIGNPFNFNKWNTQYAVFQIDLKDFNSLDSIIFFQQGFISNSEYELQWPPSTFGGNNDIFVKNLQIYALNPLDNQSGNYTLKVEPSNGMDIVLNSKNNTTYFQATMLRMLSENLTYNEKVAYYWFKQDSAQKTNNYPAGAGWKTISNNIDSKSVFKTELKDNKAYKNVYKCVAIYEPSSDDKVILSYTFSVYNEDAKIDMKLESDLGTEFSFDAGSPTITALINTDRINSEVFEEKCYLTDENPEYRYIWSIEDSTNNEIIFLDDQFELLNNENVSIENIMLINAKQNLLRKIKAYTLSDEGELQEVIDPYRATRVKYPVSIMSSGFTITCYLQHYDSGEYYDIGSASLSFTNQDSSLISDYRIQIINGDQVFQYDEYGNTPCAQKNKNPLEIKPLQAKLFAPSGIEVENTNYQVEWIFPIEDTMISTNETLKINPATDLVQSYINQNVSFNIAEIYDPNAYANQITCHIYFNNKDYYKDTNFYFGKQGANGTNGTDMIAKIEYIGNDINNILRTQPLTLYTQKENNGKVKGMFNTAISLSENCVLTAAENTEFAKDSLLKATLYQKGTALGTDNFATGYPRWNIAGNYGSESTNTTAKFFTITDAGQTIIWNYNTNNTANKYYRMQNLRASIKTTLDDQMYYAFFSLPIIEYEYKENALTIDLLLRKNRISIDKNYYLNEIVYNADGRNPIYNHNQGLRLYNIPSNINKIIWTAAGGWVEDENEPSISLLEEKDGRNSMLSLETVPQDNMSMIYVLPNDIFDGSITNNRVEARLFEDDILIATVYAPIHMSLNTFGLASLNAWDGNTVTVDEEGGYIMAPQIGAGEKDSNNRFTGILMGKTETYTGGSDNEKQIGLFGYSNGLQSIFLDAKTGNATFGLPDVEVEKDENGNIISQKFKHTSRTLETEDNYNEGRIELRPGGVSKIGGWRLGHRGIYYTQSGTIEKRIIPDYIPDINTGQFKQDRINDPYSKHHEKDINYKDSGILLHSGTNPYISIKGRQLTTNDIPDVDVDYIRPNDSLELQLDPMAPTIFTIFRHNGSDWTQLEQDSSSGAIVPVTKYEKGSRTFLAGINGKGEFVANTVSSIIVDNSNDVYTTQFSVNSFRAFNDPNKYIDNQGQEQIRDRPGHTGLRIKLGSNILGQMFINNNGFNADINNENHNSTLYITGGLTDRNGEYARPLSLHGKHISLFAQGSRSAQNFLPITDSELSLQTNKFEVNLGDSGTTLKLFREEGNDNNLMTMGNFKINAGAQINRESEEYIYYQSDNNIEKINVRNNPLTYLIFKDSNNNNIYLINNSWTPGFYYYNVGTTDSEYYVSQENYSICYKLLDNYYCTSEDFNTDYYKIINIPSTVEELDYLYLDKEYMDQHRYTKSNNEYIKVEDNVPYNLNQYVQIPQKEELIDIEQSYFYIPKTDIDLEKLYGFYNINGNNKYVYLVDENLYNKINNNYILSEDFYLETKLKYNNNIYDLDEIDLDSIYYYCTETESYISDNILDITYVKNDPIIEEIPVLDDENNIIYDNEGNIITTTQTIDMGYRLYDINIDYNVTQENIYFLYNNNYIPISSIRANTENFIEYVLIDNDYVEKNNIETVYLINNELVSESDYNNAINNLYYKVADKDNNIYYIAQNNFSIDKFIYYYSDTLINNSNYINRIQLNLSDSYNYNETNKIYYQDDNGILYQTFIINPNTKNSEYIPIKQNSTSNDAYINRNNVYIYNRLYPENPWHLKNNLTWNEEEINKYTYYFNETDDLIIRPFEKLNTYYAVRDVNNNLYYILSSYLDNYTGDKYIFINNNYRKIINNPIDEDDNPNVLISKKRYELYAGSYFSRITTNVQSNNYISLEGNNKGINLFNSSGPISIFSTNKVFQLKLNSGEEISFGSISTKFKNEYIIGKFIKNNVEDGLSFTNNWLRLKSPSIQIDNNNHFELISKRQGNGNVYTTTNPQIVLRAGSENTIVPGITKPTGAAVELILNSSNNNWKSAIKGTKLENRGAWPVFAIKTSYSKIGIYPEIFSKNNLYREIFYVAMNQCNSMGLSVQGTIPDSTDTGLSVTKNALIGGTVTTKKGFIGNGTKVTNTCGNSSGTFSPSGGGTKKTLGTTISITTLKATIKNGRPTFGTQAVNFSYAMPTAAQIPYGKNSTVASALASLASKISALEKAGYATKTYVDNKVNGKADKNHSHSFKYDTFKFKDKDGGTHTAVYKMSSTVGGTNVVVK